MKQLYHKFDKGKLRELLKKLNSTQSVPEDKLTREIHRDPNYRKAQSFGHSAVVDNNDCLTCILKDSCSAMVPKGYLFRAKDCGRVKRGFIKYLKAKVTKQRAVTKGVTPDTKYVLI